MDIVTNETKTRVLVLHNELYHYRIPIFNLLSEKYDLTVAYTRHTKDELLSQCDFNTIEIPFKKYGKFYFHKKSMIKDLCDKADVVIIFGQITYVSYTKLAFRKRAFKLISWSIGAPSSYSRHYGEKSSLYVSIADSIRRRLDALIFYCERSKELHVERGFKAEKIFVANNTVKIDKIMPVAEEKRKLLFIGTFYLEKGLQDLLDSYKSAYVIDNTIPKLVMVGGGKQYPLVEKWVVSNKLEHKIELKGPIYDQSEKTKIFASTLACISPRQAGLAVLESMGYGIPFITEKNAITGGELFNIQNGMNGIIMDSVTELTDILVDLSKNRDKYIHMGQNAYNYYWTYRTPEIMAQGISDAIEYSLQGC